MVVRAKGTILMLVPLLSMAVMITGAILTHVITTTTKCSYLTRELKDDTDVANGNKGQGHHAKT